MAQPLLGEHLTFAVGPISETEAQGPVMVVVGREAAHPWPGSGNALTGCGPPAARTKAQT